MTRVSRLDLFSIFLAMAIVAIILIGSAIVTSCMGPQPNDIDPVVAR